jgi:hypothetical protein
MGSTGSPSKTVWALISALGEQGQEAGSSEVDLLPILVEGQRRQEIVPEEPFKRHLRVQIEMHQRIATVRDGKDLTLEGLPLLKMIVRWTSGICEIHYKHLQPRFSPK